jgi:hypothetical protein
LKSEKLSSLKKFFWLVTKGDFFLPEEKHAALLIQEMENHSEGNVLLHSVK